MITVIDEEDVVVMRGPSHSTHVVVSSKHAGGSTDERYVVFSLCFTKHTHMIGSNNSV
jgi:hypothetical protein